MLCHASILWFLDLDASVSSVKVDPDLAQAFFTLAGSGQIGYFDYPQPGNSGSNVFFEPSPADVGIERPSGLAIDTSNK